MGFQPGGQLFWVVVVCCLVFDRHLAGAPVTAKLVVPQTEGLS